ncbi:unnamed protein product [Symbiodinium microadriaticum]|nr:unnamed protein product [Symbiodinium microadriaticum]
MTVQVFMVLLQCCLWVSLGKPALKVVPNGPPMPHMPKGTTATRQEVKSEGREKSAAIDDLTAPKHADHAEATSQKPSTGSSLSLPCEDVYLFHSQVKRSPVLMYTSHISTWLAKSPHQAGVATVAVVIGLLCAWNGPRVWQALVIAASSLIVAWLVHFEAVLKNLVPSLFAELVLTLAAASAVALAVHTGFEGSQVLVGAFAGFTAASYCSDWAHTVDDHIAGAALLWYCFGGAFGTWILLAWRRELLSTVAPLFGSFLVVSGSGSLLSRAVSLPCLPQRGVWSVDALVLLGPAGTHALAWHMLCILLAVSCQRSGRPVLALSSLIAFTSLVALGALLAGIQCHTKDRRADGTRCPAFLAVPDNWQWQLSGCTAWVMLTLVSGWKQIVSSPPTSGAEQGRGTLDSRARGIYVPVEEVSTEDGLASDKVDPLKTLLPSQQSAHGSPALEKPLTLSGFVHSVHARRLGGGP